MNKNFILRPIWRGTSLKHNKTVITINNDLKKLGFKKRISKAKVLDLMVNHGLYLDSSDLTKLVNKQI